MQLEVDILKERNKNNLKNSQELDRSGLGQSRFQTGGFEEGQLIEIKVNIDQLTKMHESFKKETVVGLNKVNSILGNLLKSGRVLNTNGKDGNTKSSVSLLGNQHGNMNMMDDDAFTFLEGRMSEQEKELRKAIGDNRKDLTDMINTANATVDDLKNKYNKLSMRPFTSAKGHCQRRSGL